MKRVVFVDMLEKDFEQRGTEFEEWQEMFLPDAYDLIDWYQEQDDVVSVEKCSANTFVYEIFHTGYETAKRVVHVIDVEKIGHDDEIDGKDD